MATETNQIDITPAEWKVMRLIWSLGSSSTTDIITEFQRQSDWKTSTIKTLLRRLCDKNLLTTTKDGRQFMYHPQVSEQLAMNETAEALFTQLCEMHKGQVLLDLVQKSEISRGDIQALQAALAKKLLTAPEEVDCNCLPDRMANCQEHGKE
ncbi:CopY/TcrY family copper transport repressor [Fructilactobacillus cliffordii]|uniref:CopY/TcrY family copper transport repressor n=1 Tax=Fructilactobacillus cliffordii TaxID=2940299 RepID=UPI002092E9FA|nr:CopY/TcrY family copper transport repressor [Fructilactobacillus cliffordii]USS86214.1 CopY/TcrY family copper transport repressor [Fructilactobacillus cliffordii]